MKTTEERTQTCITCKHKDFNPSCGIVCGLTKAKATFENECPDYDKDEMQIKELAEKARIQQDSIVIKGWFAIFLWVGMAGYSLLSLIVAAVNAIGSGFSAAFSLMYLSSVSVMFAVAVCAIIAFYRRRPNAVALATTYIIMIAADGALQFIISLILNDGSLMPPIRRILWGMGWFLFLQKSDDVEDLIPVISRVWNRFEKIALAVFAVATVATTATAASARFSDTAQKFIYTKKAYLKHNIAAIEKQLPIKFNDIISLSKVNMEKECVVYTMQVNGLYKTEMNKELLTAMDKKQKQDILASMCDDIKSNKFIATCLKYGYVVRLNYVDAISLPLFQFEITPEEYKSSIGR